MTIWYQRARDGTADGGLIKTKGMTAIAMYVNIKKKYDNNYKIPIWMVVCPDKPYTYTYTAEIQSPREPSPAVLYSGVDEFDSHIIIIHTIGVTYNFDTPTHRE